MMNLRQLIVENKEFPLSMRLFTSLHSPLYLAENISDYQSSLPDMKGSTLDRLIPLLEGDIIGAIYPGNYIIIGDVGLSPLEDKVDWCHVHDDSGRIEAYCGSDILCNPKYSREQLQSYLGNFGNTAILFQPLSAQTPYLYDVQKGLGRFNHRRKEKVANFLEIFPISQPA